MDKDEVVTSEQALEVMKQRGLGALADSMASSLWSSVLSVRLPLCPSKETLNRLDCCMAVPMWFWRNH